MAAYMCKCVYYLKMCAYCKRHLIISHISLKMLYSVGQKIFSKLDTGQMRACLLLGSLYVQFYVLFITHQCHGAA